MAKKSMVWGGLIAVMVYLALLILSASTCNGEGCMFVVFLTLPAFTPSAVATESVSFGFLIVKGALIMSVPVFLVGALAGWIYESFKKTSKYRILGTMLFISGIPMIIFLQNLAKFWGILAVALSVYFMLKRRNS